MREALQRLTPEQRATLFRIAKTRCRAFFSDPKAMIVLRQMVADDSR